MLRLLQLVFPLLFILVTSPTVIGQQSTIKVAEDSLKYILRQISTASTDSQRLISNSSFQQLLCKTLTLKGSYKHPFDSLKPIGKIASPDNKFRIIQWNFRMDDGTYRFFSFIQIPGNLENRVITLSDHFSSLDEPEIQILNADNWYGAQYYNIIPVLNENSDTLYTLLGWNGNNSLVTQKVIEILSFDKQQKVTFGSPIFSRYNQGKNTRVIFRYSAQTSMILKPDYKRLMIICDRLIPLDPQLEGIYQQYVPSSEVFDGFIFDHGKWLYTTGIDANFSR